MPRLNDTQLLSDYASTGSPDAFRTLVDRHFDLVYSAARRQLRDQHEAQDIAEAIFIILAQKPPHH